MRSARTACVLRALHQVHHRWLVHPRDMTMAEYDQQNGVSLLGQGHDSGMLTAEVLFQRAVLEYNITSRHRRGHAFRVVCTGTLGMAAVRVPSEWLHSMPQQA